MKRFIKNNLLGFIIGVVLATFVSTYATITYNASQIKYTKSDNSEVTLDSALNELYTEADSVSDLQNDLSTCSNSLTACNNKSLHFGEESCRQSLGALTTNRSASVPLGPGTYIVTVTGSYGAINPTSSFTTATTNNYSSWSLPISCSSCSTKLLTTRYLHPVADVVNTSYTASGKKLHIYSIVSVYYVSVTAQTDVTTTMSMSWSGTWSAEDVAIMAVPVSIS